MRKLLSALLSLAGCSALAGYITTQMLNTNDFSISSGVPQTVSIIGGGGGSGGAATNLPTVIVYPNGYYYANGVYQSATNSLTCGIQEAINALPVGTSPRMPSGGTIIFAPGTYLVANTITDYVHSTIVFEGSGISACGIVMTNPLPRSLLTIDPATPQSSYGDSFFASDMFFATITNACTNIVSLYGPQNSSGNYVGNISRGGFYRCWFGWWPIMTNSFPSYNFTPDMVADGTKHNLLPLVLNNNYGDDVTVEGCQFTAVNSLSIANDHFTMIYNVFEGGGSQVANDWPSSSVYRAGAAVVFMPPTSPNDNGNKSWHIYGNVFVGNAPYVLLDVAWPPNYTLDLDKLGTETTGGGSIVTTGYKIIINNPALPLQTSYNPVVFYDITNTSDYTKPWQLDTGLVVVADSAYGFNNLPFNATNKANVFAGTFSGSGGGLTSLNVNGASGTLPAAALYNTGPITLTAGPTFPILTNGFLIIGTTNAIGYAPPNDPNFIYLGVATNMQGKLEVSSNGVWVIK